MQVLDSRRIGIAHFHAFPTSMADCTGKGCQPTQTGFKSDAVLPNAPWTSSNFVRLSSPPKVAQSHRRQGPHRQPEPCDPTVKAGINYCVSTSVMKPCPRLNLLLAQHHGCQHSNLRRSLGSGLSHLIFSHIINLWNTFCLWTYKDFVNLLLIHAKSYPVNTWRMLYNSATLALMLKCDWCCTPPGKRAESARYAKTLTYGKNAVIFNANSNHLLQSPGIWNMKTCYYCRSFLT